MGWNYLAIPRLDGCTIKGWEWVGNCIPYFVMHVLIIPCWDSNEIVLVKGPKVSIASNCESSQQAWCRMQGNLGQQWHRWFYIIIICVFSNINCHLIFIIAVQLYNVWQRLTHSSIFFAYNFKHTITWCESNWNMTFRGICYIPILLTC